MSLPIPAIIDFPLRGEWITPNTPGTKIPSHGTDAFAETYAIDFVGVESGSRSTQFYRSHPLRYLLLGVSLRECYGWDRPIFAASSGTVIRAEDGWPERDPVNLFRDFANMTRNARDFSSGKSADVRPLTGNYIIIEGEAGFFVYAHARNGSIRVTPGEKVTAGQVLANVGHSGNSTAPHLHFQLMDSADPWTAKGLPCCFHEYEVLQDSVWHTVENGIPKATDRIRKQ